MRGSTLKSYVLKGHEKPITKIRTTQEGDYFVSCSADKKALLWNMETLTAMGEYNCTGAVSDCSISNDGKSLYLCSRDGILFLFELETGNKIFGELPIKDCFSPIKSIELSPNNEIMLLLLTHFGKTTSGIYSYDPKTKQVKELTSKPNSEKDMTRCKWISNDTFVYGDENGILFVHDIRQKDDVLNFEAHKGGAITDIESDRNDLLLGSTGKDGKCHIHDIRNVNDIISTFEAGYPLQTIGIAPFNDFYAVGGGQERSVITLTQRDMTMLMTVFVNAITGEEMVRLPGHFGTVNTIEFSNNGKTIISGADDGCIRISPLNNQVFQSH